MPRARIDETAGRAAVRSASVALAARAADPSAPPPVRDELATAVRYLLQCLSDAAPGKSVEVRVPPFGAVQIVEGPRHTRGTPPNVVELDAPTFLALARGDTVWGEALAEGRIQASGARSDLSALLPVAW
ncbi:MAG: sterol carrier family protein [Microcella sp.]|uniref:sterol carrier family protein n=1 Tax=Microcella sp. TaxID=1913979 RepID=UPI0027160C3A|nr:sterol carrier family protein [Microcella sp.]MDO8338349.1 sterol carrier family protein [Microcella sp.]